jgi:hypothetical protein
MNADRKSGGGGLVGSKPRDGRGQQLLFDADVYCVRCGRRLKSDRGRRRKLGRACWRKAKNAGG